MHITPETAECAAELLQHFNEDDEWTGLLMGVLTGTATVTFAGMGEVAIELSNKERAEYLSAIIRSKESYPAKSTDRFMSEELLMLMSGHKPERYRILAKV